MVVTSHPKLACILNNSATMLIPTASTTSRPAWLPTVTSRPLRGLLVCVTPSDRKRSRASRTYAYAVAARSDATGGGATGDGATAAATTTLAAAACAAIAANVAAARAARVRAAPSLPRRRPRAGDASLGFS